MTPDDVLARLRAALNLHPQTTYDEVFEVVKRLFGEQHDLEPTRKRLAELQEIVESAGKQLIERDHQLAQAVLALQAAKVQIDNRDNGDSFEYAHPEYRQLVEDTLKRLLVVLGGKDTP